jgi:hypothetical protein
LAMRSVHGTNLGQRVPKVKDNVSRDRKSHIGR